MPSQHEVARQIEDVLLHGSQQERESLLRIIERLCGSEEYLRIYCWMVAMKGGE